MKVSWRRVFFFCFSWAITCMDTLHLTRSFVWHFDQQYCRSLSVVWYPWLAARAMLREAQSSAAPRCNDLYRVLTDRRVSLTHCCNAEDFPASVQGTHLAFMIAASWCWVLHSRASVFPLLCSWGGGETGGRHGAFIWIWKQARWWATGTFGVRARSEIQVRLEVFSGRSHELSFCGLAGWITLLKLGSVIRSQGRS